MAVDKFGIELDLDVSGLQSELIKAQNELRKTKAEMSRTFDTGEIKRLQEQSTYLGDKITHVTKRMGDFKQGTADATQSLVNLSRIAQDAPYGFIGIANNLNPLLESFQRLGEKTKQSGGAFKELSADRKSTRLNSSHTDISRMPSSA